MELLYLNSFYRVLRSNGFAERSTHHSAFFGHGLVSRSHRDDAINDFWVHGSTWRVLSWPGRVNDEDFAGTGDGV